jgi:hypothetical protein
MTLKMGTQADYTGIALGLLSQNLEAIPRETGHADHGECLYLNFGPTKYMDRSYVEDKLPDVEKLCAIADALGVGKYPYDEIEDAWARIMSISTHNWGLKDKQQIFVKWAAKAREVTEKILRDKAREIGSSIDYQGEETPIVVFNTLNWDRTEYITLKIPKMKNPMMRDTKNVFLRAQILDRGRGKNYMVVCFKAEHVPPMGYKSYYLTGEKQDDDIFTTDIETGRKSIENAFYKIEANGKHGVYSIFDKKENRELVNKKVCGFARLVELIGTNSKDSTKALEYPSLKPGKLPPRKRVRFQSNQKRLPKAPRQIKIKKVVVVYSGPEVARLDVKYEKTVVSFMLYNNLKKIDVLVRGNKRKKVSCVFPFALFEKSETYANIPYGTMKWWDKDFQGQLRTWSKALGDSITSFNMHYNENWHKIYPQDYPKGGKLARAGWFHMKDENISIIYSMEGTYGPMFKSGNNFYKILWLQGNQRFSFTTNRGDWEFNSAPNHGWETAHPLIAALIPKKAANTWLPEEMTVLDFDGAGMVCSVFKKSMDRKDFIIRLYQSHDRELRVSLFINRMVKKRNLALVDMMESGQRPVETRGDRYEFLMKGYDIETLRLE